ncbi:hypothetical protein [Actinocrispum wychmicini]|uniref:Uncharacterized protein n=1 Tax=Actinocrispum wychmicini TaxID=1213861 RepID=A0A4R2JFU1_9PSEU|nr:hypothetical protein [Actinocrispum wychmicini]TCO57112.1 hypothetical protein EV192_106589 [Actinocrispum wychmicini]
MDILVAVGTLVAAAGGLAGLGSLVTVRSTKRKISADAEKTEADAVQVLSATAVSLLEPAAAQVRSLRADLAAAETKIVTLTDQLADADRRIADLTRDLAKAQAQLDQWTDGG